MKTDCIASECADELTASALPAVDRLQVLLASTASRERLDETKSILAEIGAKIDAARAALA